MYTERSIVDWCDFVVKLFLVTSLGTAPPAERQHQRSGQQRPGSRPKRATLTFSSDEAPDMDVEDLYVYYCKFSPCLFSLRL